jgi:hypothetical protein
LYSFDRVAASIACIFDGVNDESQWPSGAQHPCEQYSSVAALQKMLLFPVPEDTNENKAQGQKTKQNTLENETKNF